MEKTFFDFCSGIGGGRLGFEKNGFTCVGHCEIDEKADKTYQLFYNDGRNYGDLMKVNPKELPDFNYLIAGFPCQTFSIVGKREGFNDKRGEIIYGLKNILKEKNTPFFIMENVKGLANHEKGKTLKKIIELLKELDYHVEYKILDSLDYGVSQMRERLYIVGMKRELYKKKFNWEFKKSISKIEDFLIDVDNKELDINNETFQKYLSNKYNAGKYNIDELLNNDYLVLDTRQSDLRIYNGKVPTLRTGRHGILYIKNRKIKKLSGYEALLLQGIPEELAEKAKNSETADGVMLSQAGNAMTVPVICEIVKELKKYGEI